MTNRAQATALWKWSLFVLFALNGLGFASWVTRTPAVRDILGISTAWMGVVLLALALGAITGLLGASALIGRFGAKAVILAAGLMAAGGLAIAGAGAAWQTQAWVLAGLAVLGAGNGIAEVDSTSRAPCWSTRRSAPCFLRFTRPSAVGRYSVRDSGRGPSPSGCRPPSISFWSPRCVRPQP